MVEVIRMVEVVEVVRVVKVKRMVKMVKVHPIYSMTKRAGAWFGNKLIPRGLMRSNLSTALT